ncbi:hypothetical protein OQA88_9384 [Cercophora sp. LCS_1]
MLASLSKTTLLIWLATSSLVAAAIPNQPNTISVHHDDGMQSVDAEDATAAKHLLAKTFTYGKGMLQKRSPDKTIGMINDTNGPPTARTGITMAVAGIYAG